MSASATCKKWGLKNVLEMERLSNLKSRMLYNWYRKNNEAFMVILAGCLAKKQAEKKTEPEPEPEPEPKFLFVTNNDKAKK